MEVGICLISLLLSILEGLLKSKLLVFYCLETSLNLALNRRCISL